QLTARRTAATSLDASSSLNYQSPSRWDGQTLTVQLGHVQPIEFATSQFAHRIRSSKVLSTSIRDVTPMVILYLITIWNAAIEGSSTAL
ncbi:MAG: hypothetical protein DI563_02925, partial [Variovorax paradoxus]